MSIRPHPTKGKGWWVIDHYPEGRKGQRIRECFSGSKAAAEFQEQILKHTGLSDKYGYEFSHIPPPNYDGQCIYFMQQGRSGPIKIGHTRKNIAGRLSSIRVASPVQIKLIGFISAATLEEEKALHERFKEEHLRGEWFIPSPRLVAYIKKIATGLTEQQAIVNIDKLRALTEKLSNENRCEALNLLKSVEALFFGK